VVCGPFNFLNGLLGKANEVDMKNEILEDVGKREILQNSEREEHKEESEEQEVQTLHADENTKAEKMIEETDGLSTVMLPDSRFTEQIPSLTEPMSGNASSNDGSGGDGLRMETESADTAAQQPVSKEAEHGNLNPRTTENSEVGSLQGKCIARVQVSAFPVQRQHGAKGYPSCGDKFKHFPFYFSHFETTKCLPRHIPSITRGELRAVNLNIVGGRSMTNPALTGSLQSQAEKGLGGRCCGAASAGDSVNTYYCHPNEGASPC